MKKILSYGDLESFIRDRMQMSHIYQPVMLRVLLDRGGYADIMDIARALLGYDHSQVEYYELRVKKMVGRVLTRNGIVEPVRDSQKIIGYRLMAESLTSKEIAALRTLCEKRLEAYIDKRGDDIWGHRKGSEGYVPGSVRYEVLKRARYRCELCGAHEYQAALQVDHILPKACGGKDDINNYQALCVTCNTNKRDRDDTDYRGMLSSYEERAMDCIFCNIDQNRIITQSELCFAIRDGFPVTNLHTLIIPKRHVPSYFNLYQPELNAVHRMLDEQRTDIFRQDQSVSGFNVGINVGECAGQTIFHTHIHLIPRREGDVSKPRGGVRGIIPDKQSY